MESLFKRHDAYLSRVPMEYIRDFMQRVNWDSRLLVIRGPKGVGKSTLMLQYIKQHFPAGDRHVLYCSADTNYFSTHTLLDLADNFVMMGGKWLFIDEVHKYPGWSREIKEIYDLYSELHIVMSGSSLIQLNDGQADLSRVLCRTTCQDYRYANSYTLTQDSTSSPFRSINYWKSLPRCVWISRPNAIR